VSVLLRRDIFFIGIFWNRQWAFSPAVFRLAAAASNIVSATLATPTLTRHFSPAATFYSSFSTFQMEAALPAGKRQRDGAGSVHF